jgi:predicted alpha/beta-fold hydrolase
MQETKVYIKSQGDNVVGIFTRPDHASRNPLVLMLHGFTGSKEEITIKTRGIGLYTLLSHELAKHNIARFVCFQYFAYYE